MQKSNATNANVGMSAEKPTATKHGRSELAQNFYYQNQFGFQKAPSSQDSKPKLRSFAAALCNVAGADGSVTEEERLFIEGYCFSRGYPQSVIDAIPEMCRAAESKSLDDVTNEAKELFAMTDSSRQVIYDAIRAAGADGLCAEEKEAIVTVAKAFGLTSEELDKIHALVEKERLLAGEREKILVENEERCHSHLLFSKSARRRSLLPLKSTSPEHTEPIPIVLISDPGQDLDDEMMFIMACHLNHLDLLNIRGVVANLHPSFARARLARGTFDMLGLPHVPVAIGSDGGDIAGKHSSKQFESAAESYILREEEATGLENGQDLLKRLYQEGVVANLHPSFARARLARGTFDMLGLPHVPVAIGSDGGDIAGKHSSKQFESAAESYILREEEATGLENGQDLLKRLYQEADDLEYVDVNLGAGSSSIPSGKKAARGGLTMVITSSMKDSAIFVRENPELFASKTREVVVMGGVKPVTLDDSTIPSFVECEPDTAHNNMFDQEASAYFYSQCQKMKITLTVVSRHSAYAAKVPRTVYDDLALTGSAIGIRLCNSQKSGIDQLWQRASSDDPEVRKGLPPRCDRKWFTETFCGGNDDPSRGSDDSLWDLVTGFMQYDTLALLAAIPAVREMYFDPIVLPPLITADMEGGAIGSNSIRDAKSVLGIGKFGKGTRRLIGISAKEHNLKEPALLVSLLKTGYRQGILCNHHIQPHSSRFEDDEKKADP
eukprot:CAMPEP_0183744862 /NCGR_PEP_ID=MMETSP0737-20130205/65945_1 /TAXON_ID=385413 /ORGANISM="Thalassiosira miniscula, Strain CCMP1093" /LENGTH=722 /DNA_ID=CAMNT_0025980515 /DNA_START=203 /DNA_END=2371 /DNA_ORIENTATION=-